jgi:hypothetical protein
MALTWRDCNQRTGGSQCRRRDDRQCCHRLGWTDTRGPTKGDDWTHSQRAATTSARIV